MNRAYVRAVNEERKRQGIARVHKVRGHEYGRVHFHDDVIVVDLVTCGGCGRTWNDALITGCTPAPSARCPFEGEVRHAS